MAIELPPISDLEPEHQVTLFPSLGYYDSQRGCWRAQIHGRVYSAGPVPLGRRLLLKGLRRAMNAAPEQLASDTFRQRIDGFLTSPEGRRRIVLEIAGERHQIRRRSRRNGAFWGWINLPSRTAYPSHSWTETVHLCRADNAVRPAGTVAGTLFLVQPQGVSIVSDIDDTIKLTETTSKKRMLANTFLHPFAAVQGMPELYQHWQQSGCDFHYVSRSPWELYEPLAELCSSSGFPAGSMHLRYFRVSDEVTKRLRPVRHSAKAGIIAGLLKRMPRRQFVLVGDSGEKDPEIYGFLADRFPEQVAAILIREVDDARPAGACGGWRSLATAARLVVYRLPEEIRGITKHCGDRREPGT